MFKKIARKIGITLAMTSLLVMNVPAAYATESSWLPPTAVLSPSFGFTGYPVPTTSHYKNVDETTCNGNTDYNYTTSLADETMKISLASIPDGVHITRIEFVPCLSAYNPGSQTDIRIRFRWNGVFQNEWKYYLIDGGTIPIDRYLDSWGKGPYEFPTPLTKDSSSVASLEIESGGDFYGTAKISNMRVKFTYSQ